MPALVRLYIRHVLIGFALALIFVGLLLALNVGGLRHLILTSPTGLLAVAMLVIFNGIVFAGVQFGFAIMAMEDGNDRPGGQRDHLPLDVRPLPVAAGRKWREPRQP